MSHLANTICQRRWQWLCALMLDSRRCQWVELEHSHSMKVGIIMENTEKNGTVDHTIDDPFRHPLFTNALQAIEEGGKIINADPNIITRLKQPKRTIIVAVPVRMDDYNVKVFTGYRVQYNSTLGPHKGGTRYHQDVCLGEV